MDNYGKDIICPYCEAEYDEFDIRNDLQDSAKIIGEFVDYTFDYICVACKCEFTIKVKTVYKTEQLRWE